MILNIRNSYSSNGGGCGGGGGGGGDDDKVTIDLFLYFIKHHVMKAYGGVEMSA